MLLRTSHRGPDGCGLHAAGRLHHAPDPATLAARTAGVAPSRVVLGQSRLAITGDGDALQPFVSKDGRLALAHNGEIYNHAELARHLPPELTPESGSDSETLMGVFEQQARAAHGDIALALQRTVAVASGMYAIAVTDGEHVALARDAIGKKPLYYVDADGLFAFASERKGLAEIASERNAVIERLPPGTILSWRRGEGVTLHQAERLSAPAIDTTDPEVALAAYSRALDQAMTRRTRGLTRAAVFFSGGVDSVLVARLLQRAGVETTGYVVGGEDSSDVRHALAVAQEMGLPVHVTRIDADLVAEALPRIVEAAELHGPMMTEVSVPMWFAAKAAHADGHRVVFTGQAADELFAGYPWYRTVHEASGPLALHARLWEDISALPLDTLEREDRISMAWSLEMRAPFLDADVIRVAARMSPDLKLEGPEDEMGKRVHRRLAALMGVPRSVAWREKVPAQDGASVHDLLEEIATRAVPDPVEATAVPDFGSNYRYRDAPGTYGSPRVRAYLARLVSDHGLLVADADGTARPPGKRARDARLVAPTAGP